MLNLKAGQWAQLTVEGQDAYGNPAPIEDPVWSVSDEAVLRIEPDTAARGAGPKVRSASTGAKVYSAGPVGTSLVELNADAVVGEGVRPIVGTLDVIVSAGDVVAVSITAGPPQDPTARR